MMPPSQPSNKGNVPTLWRPGLWVLLLLLLAWPPSLPAQPPLARSHNKESVSVAAMANYTPHIPPRAISYQRKGRILGLAGVGWKLLAFWLLLRTGLAVRLRNATYRLFRKSPPESDVPPDIRLLAVYYLLFSALIWAWMMPIALTDLALEHIYGFSRESVIDFLSDSLLNELIGMLNVLLLWLGYQLYTRKPRTWWLWLWAGMVPLLYFIIVLQPIVIAPLFNKYSPMPNSPLRTKILALADRAGIHNATVLIENTSIRSTHINAYVTGLGPSARIVLNDTDLKKLPEDQLLAMLGHEMGHYVEKHILIGFFSGSLGIGVFLFCASRILPWAVRKQSSWHLKGVCDLASLPLLMLYLALFQLLQAPVENAISRTLEHRADAFGLRLTHLNEADARLFVGFAERDYSDPNPPPFLQFWFGTHPTLSERIKFALTYHPWERSP